jgi:multidrug transporter EmrE-like cation transporter
MIKYLPWAFMFSAVIVSAFSQVLLKKSAQKKHSSVLKEYLNVNVIVGYGMMALTTVLTVFAYSAGLDYKNGPVIESFGYVLVMLLSLAFFGEKITPKKLLGNGLVVLGIIIFYI